jgi:hypothetical protein
LNLRRVQPEAGCRRYPPPPPGKSRVFNALALCTWRHEINKKALIKAPFIKGFYGKVLMKPLLIKGSKVEKVSPPAAHQLKVSFPAANTAIGVLVDLDILREHGKTR